ncbi:hypothetical protein VP01_768g6 [Puccinia sorghi]|uniref:Uncharacterized protein n=1 Tax=Puccinia sorghi TaxID=27349 RepID=A0A0L6UCJ5_9BASI|nr:hypothetical protein VP01_768g6 [Puccinia sorghi]
MLCLGITQADFEVCFKYSDKNSSSGTGRKVEELVLALIAIKKHHYLAKRVRLERAPDITRYFFRLNTGYFRMRCDEEDVESCALQKKT